MKVILVFHFKIEKDSHGISSAEMHKTHFNTLTFERLFLKKKINFFLLKIHRN